MSKYSGKAAIIIREEAFGQIQVLAKIFDSGQQHLGVWVFLSHQEVRIQEVQASEKLIESLSVIVV